MRRPSFWLVAAASLAFVTGMPARAYAGDTSTAEDLFEEGMKALKREDFKAACEAFAGSNEADPSPGTEINLALCNEKQGKLATAWGWYRTAGGLAEQRGQRERAERARSEASRIEPMVPKLRITTKDSPSTLTVTRDGSTVPVATIGKDAPVDPGKHVIEVAAKGKKSWKGTVDIAPGGRVTPFEVPALEDAPEEKVAATPGGAEYVAPAGSSTGGTAQRNIGFVVGGAGIVAGAVAVGLQLLANHEDDKRQEQEAIINAPNFGARPAREQQSISDSRKSHEDAANSNQLLAIVTGASGVVLLGVGVTLILTSNSSAKTGRVDKPLIVPMIGNGTTGLGLHATF